MRLVFGRARRARGLLTAAATATLLATVLLTALSLYGGQVIDSGTRAAVAAAPPTERTILVSGSIADRDAAAARDRTVTRAVGAGLARGGKDAAPTTVTRAGYAVGQQLPTGLGDAKPGDDGLVLGSVMFLDQLPRHARLISGDWPTAGASDGDPDDDSEPTAETVLSAAVAKLLDVEVGDDLPLTDRRDEQHRTLRVVGIWQPKDPADPYWLLVPELRTGVAPGTATYGPFVVTRTDFLQHFASLASVNYLITPDLSEVTATQLRHVARDATGLAKRLDGDLSSSTAINELADRLGRSAVVATSALLVPVLLLVVIAGYALLLVAGLLTEQRRAETALIRARGAGVRQLAGLAAAEAGFVIGPALVLGAPLAVGLVSLVNRVPRLAELGLRLRPELTPSAWLVAVATAVGCGIALVAPALRRGSTYVAEQRAQSRAVRRGVIQRAGIDLALVVLALLAWFQLRQYGSPLLGLDVDPVLVAAPTIGVLAATVLALRLLPLLTGAAQRVASRWHSFGLLLGAWQAGRRRHAGTVLLLSLAVGVATLAICLEGTSVRSASDQASHRAGADLRLVEAGLAPRARADQLATMRGVTTVLPAIQESVAIGSQTSSTLLLVDTDRAAEVIRPREDLTDRPPATAFGSLAGSEPDYPIEFPRGAVRLTGTVTVTASRPSGLLDDVSASLDVRDRNGLVRGVTLADAPANKGPVRFDVPLGSGAVAGYGLRLDTELERRARTSLTWEIRDLATVDADGRRTPLKLSGSWRVNEQDNDPLVAASKPTVTVNDGALRVTRGVSVNKDWRAAFYPALKFGFQLGRSAEPAGPVDVLVTPRVLADIGGRVGSTFRLPALGTDIDVRAAGVIESVPGVTNDRALIADLETLSAIGYAATGATPRPTEWRLATDPDRHASVARTLSKITNTETIDRYAVAKEPLGEGARLVLLPAALAAALLAGLGIAVDVRATAASRAGELAVLHTVGSAPRTLSRALVTEHGLLAGLGVATGIAVGVLVAWAMGPLLLLTPDASRPVPTPVLVADPVLIGAPAVALLLVAVGLATTIARGIRRDLAALVVESSR